MITFTYTELLKTALVVAVLILLNNLQFAVKPADYFSVRAFTVSPDINRIFKSSFVKILITVAVCVLFGYFSFDNSILLTAFFVKEFLQIWTALSRISFFSRWNKMKTKYFFSCLLNFAASMFYVLWTLYQLIPSFTSGKPMLIISSDFWSTIVTIVLYIVPIPLEYAFISDNMNAKYRDINTLHADIRIVINQIDLECGYVLSFDNEIEREALANGIDKDILETILCLEYVNRSSVFYVIAEKIAVKFFKKRVIEKDYSIGLAQIKPSTAKELISESPYTFLEKMTDPQFSIKLCAKYLTQIIRKYEELIRENSQNGIETEYCLWNFIASQYLSGYTQSYRRNTLIYESVLATKCSENKQ